MQSVRESHALLALLHLLSLHVFIFFLLFIFLFPVISPICLPLPCDSAMCSCHTPQTPPSHRCLLHSTFAVQLAYLQRVSPLEFYSLYYPHPFIALVSLRLHIPSHPIPSILRPLHHSHPSALRGPRYACSHTCMRRVSLPLFFIIVHVFCVLF